MSVVRLSGSREQDEVPGLWRIHRIALCAEHRAHRTFHIRSASSPVSV